MSTCDRPSSRRPTSMVLVPIGDLDYFAVRRILDSLGSRELESSITLDLSALSFCDSSVAMLLDWADEIGPDHEVRVVSGRASDTVLSLLGQLP